MYNLTETIMKNEKKNSMFLDLNLFATKKTGGNCRQGYDSHSKRLGLKKNNQQPVITGNILVRQRGMKLKAGSNVGVGKDHTLFSLTSGRVKFTVKNGKKTINVI